MKFLVSCGLRAQTLVRRRAYRPQVSGAACFRTRVFLTEDLISEKRLELAPRREWGYAQDRCGFGSDLLSVPLPGYPYHFCEKGFHRLGVPREPAVSAGSRFTAFSAPRVSPTRKSRGSSGLTWTRSRPSRGTPGSHGARDGERKSEKFSNFSIHLCRGLREKIISGGWLASTSPAP